MIDKDKLEIQKIREQAPRPFGLYSSTCIGLDGGMQAFVSNCLQDTNFVEFTKGLDVYKKSDYFPKRTPSDVVKTHKRVKLLEFAKEGRPILLVPSMVNKYYIFDLYEDNSLVKFLIENGFRPYVIDWGEPGTVEESINLKQSIDDYILPFAEYIKEKTSEKVDLIGYCMGASLGLVAVSKKPELFRTMNLIALPFNFNEMPFIGMIKTYKDMLKMYFGKYNLSADNIQTLFYMKDCMDVIARIKYFNKVEDDDQLKRMISLEDWLADCIDLDSSMTHDIVEHWYCQNKLYPEDYDLSKIDIPSSLIVAKNDSVVPLEASFSVIRHIKNLDYIIVNSGHIGILIGRKSKGEFYEELIKTLNKA